MSVASANAQMTTGPISVAREMAGTPNEPKTDEDETLLRRTSLRETLDRGIRRVDPIGWLPATVAVAREAARHRADLAVAGTRLLTSIAGAPFVSARRVANTHDSRPVALAARDKRFADPTWEHNPFFVGIRRTYLASCQFLDDVAAAGDVDRDTNATARQFLKLVQDLANQLRAHESRGAHQGVSDRRDELLVGCATRRL